MGVTHCPPGTPKPRRAQQRRQNETERPHTEGKEVLFQVSPPGRTSCSHQRVLRAGGHPGVTHTSRDPRLALGGSRRVGGHSRTPPWGWEEVGAGSVPTPARAPSPRPKGTSGGAEGPSPGAGGAGTPSATGAGAPGEPRNPGSRPACAARGPARSSRPCGCPRCRRTPAPVPWGTNTREQPDPTGIPGKTVPEGTSRTLPHRCHREGLLKSQHDPPRGVILG